MYVCIVYLSVAYVSNAYVFGVHKSIDFSKASKAHDDEDDDVAQLFKPSRLMTGQMCARFALTSLAEI